MDNLDSINISLNDLNVDNDIRTEEQKDRKIYKINKIFWRLIRYENSSSFRGFKN